MKVKNVKCKLKLGTQETWECLTLCTKAGRKPGHPVEPHFLQTPETIRKPCQSAVALSVNIVKPGVEATPAPLIFWKHFISCLQ